MLQKPGNALAWWAIRLIYRLHFFIHTKVHSQRFKTVGGSGHLYNFVRGILSSRVRSFIGGVLFIFNYSFNHSVSWGKDKQHSQEQSFPLVSAIQETKNKWISYITQHICSITHILRKMYIPVAVQGEWPTPPPPPPTLLPSSLWGKRLKPEASDCQRLPTTGAFKWLEAGWCP